MTRPDACPVSAPPLPKVTAVGLGLPHVTEKGALSWDRPLADALRHPAVGAADVIAAGKGLLAALQRLPAQDLPGAWRGKTFPELLPVTGDVGPLYTRIGAARTLGKRVAVLCSGDALFYGMAARLAEHLGTEALACLPGTSSLQAAAACLGLPWERVRPVSLHGRADRMPLAHALASGDPVFILCDSAHTPRDLAAWMQERGQDGFAMHVLDDLHHALDGAVRPTRHAVYPRPDPADIEPDAGPNPAGRVLLLLPDALGAPGAGRGNAFFGLPDHAFATEKRLITKSPVRAAALAALRIAPRHTVWDLGAGSGAVGIEAARLAYMGQVFAVERDPERIALIAENRKRFGAANLEIVHGALPGLLPETAATNSTGATGTCAATEHDALPRPHRIFVGGGLGGAQDDAEELLCRAWAALLPGGRLVAACVLLSSLELARRALNLLGGQLHISCLQASESAPLGADIRFKAHNPVFLVTADKPDQAGRQEAFQTSQHSCATTLFS